MSDVEPKLKKKIKKPKLKKKIKKPKSKKTKKPKSKNSLPPLPDILLKSEEIPEELTRLQIIKKKLKKEENKKLKEQIKLQQDVEDSARREKLLSMLEDAIEKTKDAERLKTLIAFRNNLYLNEDKFNHLEEMLNDEDYKEEEEEENQKNKAIDDYLKINPDAVPMINRYKRDKRRHQRDVKRDFGPYVIKKDVIDPSGIKKRSIIRVPFDETKKNNENTRFKSGPKVTANRSMFFNNLSEARYYEEEKEEEEEEEENQVKKGIDWADLDDSIVIEEEKQKDNDFKEKNIMKVHARMYMGFNLEPQLKYIRPGGKQETSPIDKCDKHMNIIGNYICNRPDPNEKSRWLNRKHPAGEALYIKRIDLILENDPEDLPFELLEDEKETLSRM